MLQGGLHIHSTYSDGEFTLAELRDLLLAAGCRFACVTDHADSFDADRVRTYRRECEERSDADFQFIPGLEYGCVNRLHILGYGVTSLIDSVDPEYVIANIKREGGLAVVAHPRNDVFDSIERFDPLPDGIEVWNSKYDGQYAPRRGTFALLGRLQARRPDVRAFYGLDLHWRNQHRGLFVEIACETPDRDSVLAALRRGAYVGIKAGLRLPSTGALSPELLKRFDAAHARSQLMRRWLGRAKSWIDRSGIPVPAPIKAQLRRIF
jgi:hypothetical protein